MAQHTQTLPARMVRTAPTTAAPSNNRPRIVRLQPLPADFENWVQRAKDAVLRAAVTGILYGKSPTMGAQLRQDGYCVDDETGDLIHPCPEEIIHPPAGMTVELAALVLLLIAVEDSLAQDNPKTAILERLGVFAEDEGFIGGGWNHKFHQQLASLVDSLGKRLCRAIENGHHPLDFLEQHLLSLYHMERQA